MLSLPDFKHKQIVCFFTERGEKFSFRNDNLIIKDDTGQIIHQSSCHRLFSLLIIGYNYSLTSGLLERAKKFAFSISLMKPNFRPYAYIPSATEGNFLLRMKQYRVEPLPIARHLVQNKIAMQMSMLQKLRRKGERETQVLELLKGYRERIDTESVDLPTLLGLEGVSAKLYFSAFFGSGFDWQGRRPRTKKDLANLLLDIGYTLLFNMVESLLQLYGFDVYKGVYHQNFYQRKSLVCDLMEPLRPLIDAQLRKSFSLGQIHPEDFGQSKGQYYLSFQKNKPYVALFLQEILQHKEAIFLYIQKYYRSFIREKPIKEFPQFIL